MNENLIIIVVHKDLKYDIIFNSCKNGFNFGNTNQFRSQFCKWINRLGEESAKAQLLKVSITSFAKFTQRESNDKIYLLIHCNENNVSDESAVGFVRIGTRDLYLENNCSLRHVKNCCCLLDFYIRRQRCGFGYFLMSNIISHSGLSASQLAYDRPTQAMITFLDKHFKLNPPLSQHNHFVIFSEFTFDN